MRRPTPQFRPIRRTPPPHAARMPAAPNEQVVIDGPAASGKSTVARAVAQALGAFYLSTGDIYRALTWQALARGLDPTAQPDAVVAMLAELTLDLKRGPDGRMQVWLNGTRVHSLPAIRQLKPDQDRFIGTLKAGENTILCKIAQNTMDWAACLGIRAPDGGPAFGVSVVAPAQPPPAPGRR